ncbi:unnamed protein product [Lupinus luteus]|uniref:Uncharacterized protein n=1 Tax=Lupinus luteus TaxID=3873 RepID=A0AAV1WTJ0_LUPLU
MYYLMKDFTTHPTLIVSSQPLREHHNIYILLYVVEIGLTNKKTLPQLLLIIPC